MSTVTVTFLPAGGYTGQTWTCPPGVYSATFTVKSAGGSGHGPFSSSKGGTGGAGGSTVVATRAVTPGRVYVITIGQGGASVSTNAVGNAGGYSAVDYPWVVASGGKGGPTSGSAIGGSGHGGGYYSGGAGGLAGSSTTGAGGGGSGGSGGVGGAGVINSSGGAGGSAGAIDGAAGGAGGTNGQPGTAGTFPGGGGGGAGASSGSVASGAGADGEVSISYTPGAAPNVTAIGPATGFNGNQQAALFYPGEGGYGWFGQPWLLPTAHSQSGGTTTLIAFAQAHSSNSDYATVAYVAKRSINGGITWSDLYTVLSEPATGTNSLAEASAFLDGSNNPWIAFTRQVISGSKSNQVLLMNSTDDGLTWGWKISGVTASPSSAASNGGAIQITTSANHNMTAGSIVTISGSSTSSANGNWAITVEAANKMTLVGSSYVSSVTDGTITLVAYDISPSAVGLPSTYYSNTGISTIASIANNGSGLVRVTFNSAVFTATDASNSRVFQIAFTGVQGTTDNTKYQCTVISTTTCDITGSSYAGTTLTSPTWVAYSQWAQLGNGHVVALSSGAGSAGRIVLPLYYRYDSAGAGLAFSRSLYSDNVTSNPSTGGTWTAGTILSESNGSNPGNIEPSYVETNTAGNLYATAKNVSNTIRPANLSTDGGGSTWGVWTNQDGTGGTTKIAEPNLNSGVQGVAVRLDSQTLALVHAEDANYRTRESVRLSTSSGASAPLTWPNQRFLTYGPSGYSDAAAMVDPTDGSTALVVVFERGYNSQSPNQEIAVTRIQGAAINAPTTAPSVADYYLWPFNEWPSGSVANAFGPDIRDVGPWNQRGTVVLTSTTYPTYAAGAVTGNLAIVLDGTQYVNLSPASTSALDPDYDTLNDANLSDGSFTFEVMIKANGTNGWIIGPASGTVGWTLKIASGVAVGVVYDGTHTTTITGTTTVNDNAWHRIALIHDKYDTLLHLRVDGAEDTADVTLTATSSISNYTTAKRLGMDSGGSNGLACTIDWARFTRDVLGTGSMLPANYVEPNPSPGYVAVPANSPMSLNSNNSGCVLWALATYDPRYFAARWDGTGQYPQPLATTGLIAANSCLDASNSAMRRLLSLSTSQPNGYTRPLYYSSDATVGPSWSFAATGANSAQLNVQSSSGSSGPFEFCQNSGAFVISGAFELVSTSADQTLLDNIDANVSNGGINLRFNHTSGKLHLMVGGGGFDSDLTTSPTTLSASTWYSVLIYAKGYSGGNLVVDTYLTPMAGAGSANAKGTTTAAASSGAGTYNSMYNLSLGARANSNSVPFTGKAKDFAIYNPATGSWTPAQSDATTLMQLSQSNSLRMSMLVGAPGPG